MIKKYISITVCFLFFLGYSGRTEALFFDMTPINPSSTNFQFDVPGAVASAMELVSSVNAIKVTVDNIKENLKVDELEHRLSSYVTNLANTTYGKALNKLAGKKKVTSSSRTIDEKTSVKLDNEDDIQRVFIERFLQYPSKKDKVNSDYRKIGEQFKIDTTLEMYIIAREMEIEIIKKLEELDKIEKCLLGDEECDAAGLGKEYSCQESKETEDQMCLLRTNLLVARIYDRIMWYNEFLLAMDAQYRAAMAIENGVKIRDYKEDKKQSFITKFVSQTQVAQIKHDWKVDFADMEWFDGSPAEAVVTSDGKFDIVESAGGFSSSLPGKKETFGSMKELEDTNRAIEKALRSHNTKNKLDSFRRIYETYHQAQDLLKKVVDHLRMSEECVNNYLSQYYENGLQAWTGHNCNRYDNNRIACAYDSNTQDDAGMFDVPCPQDKTQKCYVTETINTSNRSGISGLLFERYNEAKALSASGDVETYNTTDDTDTNFVTIRNVSGDEKKEIRSNSLKNGDDMNSRGESMQSDTRSKSPAVEDDMIADTYAANKLNWGIGSNITRDMVSDINNTGGFGTVVRRYPLWNDQKEFYDQYINGKYENIKQYISVAPAKETIIAAARIANSILDYSENPLIDLRSEEAKAIDDLENYLSSETITDEDNIAKAVAEEKRALEELKEKHKYNMSYIKDQIAEENEKIEILNTQIDNLNNEYNSQDNKADFAENDSKQEEENIKREDDMYVSRTEKGGISAEDIESPYKREANENIEKNDNDLFEANSQKKDLESQSKELDSQLAEHEKRVEKLKEDLDVEIKTYIKKYNEVQRSYRDIVNNALSENQSSSAMTAIASAASEIKAVETAVSAAQCIRNVIIKKIENAEEKYNQLRETNSLYYPKYTSSIQEIHKDMINEIMKISSSDVSGCGDVEDQIFASVTVEMFVQEIMSMCIDGDFCTTPETDNGDNAVYFVSLAGRERDFRAPTGPLAVALPPLREIFYFDEFDYDNVERYFEGDEEPRNNREITITGDSFLTSGPEMPKIWEYILKVRAFEEKEFDIEALFKRGEPHVALSRSGIFPCRLNGRIVDAAVKEDGDEIIFGYNPQGISDNVIEQPCRLVEFQQKVTPGQKHCGILGCVSGGVLQQEHLIDTESDYAEIISEAATNVLETSELGYILAYIPEPGSEILQLFGQKPQFKLSYNQAFLNAVNLLNSPNGVDEDDASAEQYKYASRIMFKHNQFGDYLNFVEMKDQAEEMLERYKEQMLDVHQKLQEIFNEFGDTISDDFDLANQEDYDMAATSLDGYKAAYIRKAKEKLDTVNGMDTTDEIKETVDTLREKIDLLELDVDEIAEISGSENKSELEFKIKQATANDGIASEYDQKGTDEFEKQIRQLQKPYCAVYAK